MALTPAYFSDYEYFKLYQPIHKTYNKNQVEQYEQKNKVKFIGPLRPGKISAKLFFPNHIKKLEWHLSGQPTEEMKSKLQQVVDCKTHEEIQKMRECVAIGRGALDAVFATVKPGQQPMKLTKQLINKLSIMMPIHLFGEVSESSKFLVKIAYTCLQKAIEICKPGTIYRDVGNNIEKYITENGQSVNRKNCSHGVGKLFHCAPTYNTL